MIRFLVLVGSLLVESASAQPVVPCLPPMVCSAPNPNFIATSTIPMAGMFMLRAAAGLAVLMIVWCGIQMMLSLGEETKITKAKWGVVYSMAGLAFCLFAQVIVGLVATENYGQFNTLDLIVTGVFGAGVRIALTALNMIFGLALIICAIRMLLAQGKQDEFNKARTGVLWSIVGAIVVNLAHALVRAVISFFGL
jgi:hypothetical protein